VSHATGAVRFPDGKVMFYLYNATSEVAISHLYDTMQAVVDSWGKGPWLNCTCPTEMEPVEIYSSYGLGFTYPGKACRTCRALYGPRYTPEMVDATSNGEPQWHKDIPPELMKTDF
jgi:hypothetical protein